MAAVTITRTRDSVFGNQRVKLFKLTVGSSGNTLTVPGIKVINGITIASAAANAFGATVSSNVVTFAGGGTDPTYVTVMGS